MKDKNHPTEVNANNELHEICKSGNEMRWYKKFYNNTENMKVNECDHNGETPIYIAWKNRHFRFVSRLILLRADISILAPLYLL